MTLENSFRKNVEISARITNVRPAATTREVRND